MQKAYSRINWENYPSEETPVNASNLNRMDYAINEIDNRVIALDTDKLSVTDANGLVQAVAINNETGVITITKMDGSTVQLNTNLAKIALGWTYDYQTQCINLTQSDGTVASINLSTLIQDNEFADTSTIAFAMDGHLVTAIVKDHSIGDDQLRTDYLADIRVAMQNAINAESDAEADAIRSESYAIGGTQTRTGEDRDNSKFYSEQAYSSMNSAISARDEAQSLVETATARLTGLTMQVNFTDGCLYYDIATGLILQIDPTTGNLMWEVTNNRQAQG